MGPPILKVSSMLGDLIQIFSPYFSCLSLSESEMPGPLTIHSYKQRCAFDRSSHIIVHLSQNGCVWLDDHPTPCTDYTQKSLKEQDKMDRGHSFMDWGTLWNFSLTIKSRSGGRRQFSQMDW